MAQKKKMNKSLVTPMILGGIACFALGGLSGFLLSDYYITHNAAMDKGEKDSIPVDASSKGMQVKMLSTVTNDDGSVTKTIGYTVLPAAATNKDVTVKAQYADGSSCADVASVILDQENKTVAVTIKNAFSQEIQVVLTSASKASVTATIRLNYEKKLLGLNRLIDGAEIHVGSWGEETASIADFSIENFVTPEYSAFTYDKVYSFAVSEVTVPEGDFVEEILQYSDSDPDLALNMAHLLQDKINAQAAISAADIWALSETEDWQYFLSNLTATEQVTPYYHTTFTATYSSIGQPETKVVYSDVELYLSLAGDYSAFVTDVEEIQTESPSLVY